jgi:uncharacterized protein (TIGR03435 family)
MLRRIKGMPGLDKKLLLAGTGVLAAVAPLVCGLMHAQPAQAQATSAQRPKFEVASIRLGCGNPAAANGDGRGAAKGGAAGVGASPGSLNDCTTLANFIYLAYLVYPDGRTNTSAIAPHVQGGPAWVNSDRYRITAKAEGAAGPELMKGPLMQALLEDRFKLKVHREQKEVSVYSLTVAKRGLKLQRAEGCTPLDLTNPPPPPEPGHVAPKYCGRFALGRKGQSRTVDIDAMSMTEFAAQFSGWLDRPVIDKTGVVGLFGFHLQFAQDETTPAFVSLPADDPSPSAGPSVFTAFQEQLGLKLESAKGPGDLLVIDSVERPSEN